MQDSSNFKIVAISLFFALIVGSITGRFSGPYPAGTDDVTQYPPFRAYFYAASVHTPHGELGDSITEVYPWRKFAAEALRSGVMPLWNPRIFCRDTFSGQFPVCDFLSVELDFRCSADAGCMVAVTDAESDFSALFMWLFLRKSEQPARALSVARLHSH
jgi:hypothetical protein